MGAGTSIPTPTVRHGVTGSLAGVPVLVTAGHQPLARRLAIRLLEEGGEVRVASNGDVSALRAAGAFVATADGDDEGRLEAALAQVHTVVHVGGGIATSTPERIVADARTLARAAAGAEVQRIVMLSLPGASRSAEDPLRRAKAAAEDAIAAVACQTIVVRVGLVDTPALRDALLTAGLDPGSMTREVRPVRVPDLLELVVAFDRARAHTAEGHLVVAADGPAPTSIAGYLDRVMGQGASEGSRVGRRLPDPAMVERLTTTLRGAWVDEGAHLVDGWAFAGLQPGMPGPGS
ncbi:MAG: NAD(P)H-binding protein [Nitriliruptoraceae bacterium]